MSILTELGLIVGKENVADKVFDRLFPDFFKIEYKNPSNYISVCWDKFQKQSDISNSLNGKIFEYLLATLFIREGILPIYLSAKVAFVPNVIYDILFYSQANGPVCISAKTSLRERYKQADLEAIALKYVHRKALSYLITLEENEAKSVTSKIKSGDVIGLDKVIVATSSE
ncbi:MAG TPA: hypothetical protein VFQ56_02460, partial [Flavobacterium sp.]|nr:hypothetical protein [Flavobacterium sp.]